MPDAHTPVRAAALLTLAALTGTGRMRQLGLNT
jgi:hypothetical protein